jgi:hypothetical protein
MVETLGFEIFADDKASSTVARASGNLKRLTNDLEMAQIKVAKATDAVSKATTKYGTDSIQAREAVAKLARAELDAEGASTKLGNAQKGASTALQTTTKHATGLKGTLSEVGKTAAGFLAGSVMTSGLAKFNDFAKQSVEDASNLGESVNAVQKVFGSSSTQILQWGQNNAASFGLSARAFNEMATPLGSGLKNAGLSMQDTAKWTVDLTKRASDMASVFNTSVPDALDAIQAGLRGEADPLERYGVGLSAAKVQAEALAETGKATAGSLSTQELATARLNLIMKQTASTAGDFASTSNGLANSQRIATAQMENARAKLGTELLPIMAKVTSVTAQVVGNFANLPGPLQATAAGAVAVGGAALLLLPRIAAAKTALVEMGLAGEGTGKRLVSVAGAIGVIGTAMAAFKGLDLAISSLKDPAPGLNTTVKALQELQTTGKSTGPVLTNIDTAFRDLGDSVAGARGMLEKLPGFFNIAERATGAWSQSIADSRDQVSQLDQALALEVSSGNAGAAAVQMKALTESAKAQGLGIDELNKLFPQYRDAVDAAGLAQTLHAGAATTDTKAVADQKAKVDALTAALDTNKNMLLQLNGGEVGYWASVDATSQALKDNGRTLDVHTAKGRANIQALDGQATAALSYLKQLNDSGVAGAKFDKASDSMRARLYQAALAFTGSATEAKNYTNRILGIPRQADTKVNLNKAAAQAAAQSYNGILHSIPLSINTTAGFDISAARANWSRWVSILRSTPSSVNGTLNITGKASGGAIPGGPSGIDSIPALLAPGEFVVNAFATSKYRGTLEAINARRFALGGFVGAPTGLTPSTSPIVLQMAGQSQIEDLFLQVIRRIVRVRGGNVQLVFGRT